MGNRMLKDTIRTSRSVNAMTDFQFRVWIHFITYVDDYGRGSADPELLKSFAFPRRRRVTEKDIEQALADLAGMGCVSLYEVDGEPYFCFPNWSAHQRIQTKQSKFPAPCEGLLLSTVTHGESPPETKPKPKPKPKPNLKPKPNAREDALSGFGDELREKLAEWLRYKAERGESYKSVGLENLVSGVQNRQKTYADTQICALIGECMANGWKGIIWDKLEKNSPKPKQAMSAQTPGSSIDKDALDAYISGQFADSGEGKA